MATSLKPLPSIPPPSLLSVHQLVDVRKPTHNHSIHLRDTFVSWNYYWTLSIGHTISQLLSLTKVCRFERPSRVGLRLQFCHKLCTFHRQFHLQFRKTFANHKLVELKMQKRTIFDKSLTFPVLWQEPKCWILSGLAKYLLSIFGLKSCYPLFQWFDQCWNSRVFVHRFRSFSNLKSHDRNR